MGKYEEEVLEASGEGDEENQLAAAGVWGEIRTCIRELEALSLIQPLVNQKGEETASKNLSASDED